MIRTINIDGNVVDVSDDGKYVSVNGKERKIGLVHPKGSTKGFYQVTIAGWKKKYVHQLVAIAFIPNPLNYPFVVHKDSNTLNNYKDNLMWGTYSDIHRAFKTAGRERKEYIDKRSKLINDKIKFDIIKRLLKGESAKSIAEDYETSDMSIIRLKKKYNVKVNTCNHYEEAFKEKVVEDMRKFGTKKGSEMNSIDYYIAYRWYVNKYGKVRKERSYSEEFKREVKLSMIDKGLNKVAKEVSVPYSTLRRWYNEKL
jgi:hypothetical protein